MGDLDPLPMLVVGGLVLDANDLQIRVDWHDASAVSEEASSQRWVYDNLAVVNGQSGQIKVMCAPTGARKEKGRDASRAL